MMNTMKRTYLALSIEDKDHLKSLSKKRTIQAQVIDRIRILFYKSDGMTFQKIEKTCNCCFCWAHIRRYFIDTVPKGKK